MTLFMRWVRVGVIRGEGRGGRGGIALVACSD